MEENNRAYTLGEAKRIFNMENDISRNTDMVVEVSKKIENQHCGLDTKEYNEKIREIKEASKPKEPEIVTPKSLEEFRNSTNREQLPVLDDMNSNVYNNIEKVTGDWEDRDEK